MATNIRDEDNDELRIERVLGDQLRLRIRETDQDGKTRTAGFGRVNPHALVDAIHEEMSWDRARFPTLAPFGLPVTADGVQEVWDAFVKPDQEKDLPQSVEMRALMGILRWASTALSAQEEQSEDSPEIASTLADQIQNGIDVRLSFEEATAIHGRGGERPHTFQDNEQRMVLTRTDDFNFIITVTDANGEATINRVSGRDLVEVIEDQLDDAREDMPHTRPATAEHPRVWAGADEPIIDQLIGRVADLEEGKERTEAHQHLAQHWDRRLAVARQALSMTPVRGESKPVGIAAVFGTERSGEVSVTDALKIARFAADEDREIPGVDR